MSLALDAISPPVRLRLESPMTDDEFLRFCAANEPLRFEREADGEIVVMSPTGFEGGSLELDVAAELRAWALQDGGGKVVGPNSGCRLPDGSVRAADAAWVSWTRWRALSRDELEGFAPVCPEFIIEVRSKSDRLTIVRAKMEQWIANGAQLAWLIDPADKTVTIYRPGEEPESRLDPTSVRGSGLVAGFELILSRVWS